jgi:hypothetical protein
MSVADRDALTVAGDEVAFQDIADAVAVGAVFQLLDARTVRR